MKKPPVQPSKEALRLAQAIDNCGMPKAAIAERLGVSPGLVSQWAAGRRPVPVRHAPKLSDLVGVKDPRDISSLYAEAHHHVSGNAIPDLATSDAGLRSDLQLARAADDIDAIRYAVSAIISVMVVHRPAEAMDAASAMRRTVPAKFRKKGFVFELIEALERAKR